MRGRYCRDEHGKDPPRTAVRTVLLWSLAAVSAAAAVWLFWTAACIRKEDAAEESRIARLQSFASAGPDDTAQTAEALQQIRAEAGAYSETAAEEDGTGSAANVPQQAASVDFGAVLAEAPDTRAWIRIPGTNIHYPVVQADDNEYYLTHGPDGVPSRSGAIFLSAENSADFTDPNTVLYGHRMNSGTMFAQLHSYADRAFLDANPYIYITMPDGAVRTYEIFCVQKVSATAADPAYRMEFAKGADDFRAWTQRQRTGVLCARQSTAAPAKVLTLSTCCRGEEDKRLIVQAYFLREDRHRRKETL